VTHVLLLDLTVVLTPEMYLRSTTDDLMVIAFSPDPMVLIHFRFRASGNSTFKLPILPK
jgi:hypothetical protein